VAAWPTFRLGELDGVGAIRLSPAASRANRVPPTPLITIAATSRLQRRRAVQQMAVEIAQLLATAKGKSNRSRAQPASAGSTRGRRSLGCGCGCRSAGHASRSGHGETARSKFVSVEFEIAFHFTLRIIFEI
jgi:hypothetical protein